MKFIISILLLILSLQSCSKVAPTRPSDILSDKIITSVSEKLNKKYGMILIGVGGGESDDGVWLLSAMYNRYAPAIANIDEAREIILDCAQEFLNESNHNEAFRPYMRDYPFTSKNLSISIICYDEKKNNIHYPFISDFSLSNGIIFYDSLGPEVKLPYAQKVTETYEEALILSKKYHEGLKTE